MNILLFAHAGESQETTGQSFLHLVAAWYLAVPLFTVALTVVVAVIIRHLLDRYDRNHRAAAKKQHKKSEKKVESKEDL